MPAESYPETLDPRLARIVKEYLEAVERGENPSPDDWVNRHSEFAEPLRDFFASRRQLGELVREAKGTFGNEQTMDSSRGETPPAALPSSRLKYFGDYELESEIARGGMGVVFRARQVSLNRPVAVKMILSGELASPDDVARFRTEAEAAANLDHPAIVPIYEIGEREGQHYFSMKFIDGESLSQRLQGTDKKESRQALQERVELVIAVARGIHYAHQRGIIHRDLKPANILIDSTGQPHITDFGLARRTSTDSQLTRTGAIVGTPSYMAPEQALGSKNSTTAVDIYGLGAILYATLTGRPPFDGSNPLETILRVQKEPPGPPSRLSPGLDRELEVICLKCLKKDPEARYRSAGELADDLARWIRGEPIQAMPPNAARLVWRWLASNFKTAACVLVIGAVTGLLVCESVINMGPAHNLGGYALIYRGSFPGEDAPWMLKALEVYPRWIGVLVLPLMLLVYFGMGWFTDRLVKPQDLAGALLCGLGVGTTAAFTAFMFGIGWQTIIQVAVWPSQSDLELLVAEIQKDSTFSDGQTIATKYPQDILGQPVDTRYVMKKALADMQARIPLALWYGFGFSACILLLPATLQTVAAQYLRSRGDRWYWQILQMAELSIPTSLMLMALAMIVWDSPWQAAQLLLLPLVALGTLHLLRKTSVVMRRGLLAFYAALGILLLISGRANFFTSNGGPINPGLAIASTIVAVLAVVFRFRWWQRLLLYGIWIVALVFSDSVKFGARSSLDPGMAVSQQIVVSVLGSSILLSVATLIIWLRSRAMARDSILPPLAKVPADGK